MKWREEKGKWYKMPLLVLADGLKRVGESNARLNLSDHREKTNSISQ